MELLVEIFIFTWNDEKYLEDILRFYKKNLPTCKITIYDANSTDNTHTIAYNYNCDVVLRKNSETHHEPFLTRDKNNCWKNTKCKFVIVCDADEFIDISENQLLNAQWNVTRCVGYNMFSDNAQHINDITHGVLSEQYSKCALFNAQGIKEMRYHNGCHICDPLCVPNIDLIYNTEKVNLYHTKWRDFDYTVNKSRQIFARQSEHSKARKIGEQYRYSLERFQKLFSNGIKSSIKIR